MRDEQALVLWRPGWTSKAFGPTKDDVGPGGPGRGGARFQLFDAWASSAASQVGLTAALDLARALLRSAAKTFQRTQAPNDLSSSKETLGASDTVEKTAPAFEALSEAATSAAESWRAKAESIKASVAASSTAALAVETAEKALVGATARANDVKAASNDVRRRAIKPEILKNRF